MSSSATDTRRAHTIVVGLGNPILGDDGVGWRVIDSFERRLASDPLTDDLLGSVATERLAVGGLSLMEHLVGYERAVIVDAAVDGEAPGSVWTGSPDDLVERTAEHLDSAHDVTLTRALAMAAELGSELPRQIVVVTVSVAPEAYFGETLSPGVADAIEPAVDAIVGQLTSAAVARTG
jgi:hydrogenase maturation protease